MEIKQLKCPSCGATLDAKDGLDTFYCMYCGNLVVTTGRDKAAYKAKAVIKKSELDLEKRRLELEAEERESKRDMIGIYICFAIIFLGAIGPILLSIFS